MRIAYLATRWNTLSEVSREGVAFRKLCAPPQRGAALYPALSLISPVCGFFPLATLQRYVKGVAKAAQALSSILGVKVCAQSFIGLYQPQIL